MRSFFARIFAAFWRACCALLAIGTVQLTAFLGHQPLVHGVVDAWMDSALAALGLGMCAVTVMGALRLLVGARPGDVGDPLRLLARRLVPCQTLLVAGLAGLALSAAVSSFVVPAVASTARLATIGSLFLLARARHLRWFAGIRHANEGRVRFAGMRFKPFTIFFTGGILFLVSLAMLGLIGPLAIALVLVLVLGWFGWTMPQQYVTVGVDGVEVTRLGVSTFHPLDREGRTRADLEGDRLLLVRSGHRFPLSLTYGPMGEDDQRLLDRRLGEIVRKAATTRAAAPDDLAATLASLETGGGYRIAEVPRETLWRVVETPDLAPSVRLRVAELLAKDPQEDELRRLRELADDLADSRAADALARVARSTT